MERRFAPDGRNRPAITRETGGACREWRHAPARTVDGGRRVLRSHGPQVTAIPFVRLNGSLVQKSAALRYQHWYVRCPGTMTSPRTDTDESPAAGYCDVPPTLNLIPRRTTEPPAQRRPSPKAAPAPPAS